MKEALKKMRRKKEGGNKIMDRQGNRYKYIIKPGWPGETICFKAPHKNEVLRVLFDPSTTGTKQMSIWLTTFEPGKGPGLHTHPEPHEELLFVLNGKGIERVGEEVREVQTGDAIFIPPNTPHEIVNNGDDLLTLLVVAAPPGPIEQELYVHKVKKVIPTLLVES